MTILKEMNLSQPGINIDSYIKTAEKIYQWVVAQPKVEVTLIQNDSGSIKNHEKENNV